MEAGRFETLTKAMTESAGPRRLLLRGLSGLALTGWPGLVDAAGKERKGKKKRDKCRRPPCAPDCQNKTCGPDGCGGSCGACTDGKCRNGTCDCSRRNGNREVCGGNCVDLCPAGWVRNPFTCICCLVNGADSGVTCAQGMAATCCSGLCEPANDDCVGIRMTESCQFDAQCESGICLTDGTCA